MAQEYDISGENQDSSTQKPLTVNEPKRHHSSFAGPIVIIFILLLVGIGGYYIYTKGLPFKLPFNLPSNKISARALQNTFDSMGYTKMSMEDISNEESTGSLGAYTIIESEVDIRQISGGYDINNMVVGIEGSTSSTMTIYKNFKTEDSASTYVNDFLQGLNDKFAQTSIRHEDIDWENTNFEDINWERVDAPLYTMVETADGTSDDGISYHFIHYTIDQYGYQTDHIDGVWQKGTDVYTIHAQGISDTSVNQKALNDICDKLQIISPSTAFSMAAK